MTDIPLNKLLFPSTETLSEIEADVFNLLPTFGDLKGAITLMLDLHDIYNVTAGDLTKGIVRWRAAENLTEQSTLRTDTLRVKYIDTKPPATKRVQCNDVHL